MAYGLTIGTERATALQNAIQDELTTRGYSPEGDHVMAEYITIMIINNKTAAQISSELEDLIDPAFVDWLFAQVEKTAPESETPLAPTPAPEPTPSTSVVSRDPPPHLPNDSSKRSAGPSRPSAPLYQQALSQAIPSTSPSDRKRTRSRSPSHANKSRRVDLPTGPRAMQQRDGNPGGGPGGSRSLLDRVGPRNGPHGRNDRIDNIQARIDNITGNSPDMSMMMPPGGPPFPMNGLPPGMDMNAMANMANPMLLQEMMMNQMMLMQQVAGAIGMMNPNAAQMMNGGMPMQPGVGGDAGMFQGPNGGHPGGPDGRGRGRGRGGPSNRGGRGRGGHMSNNGPSTGEFTPANRPSEATSSAAVAAPAPAPVAVAAPIAAPTPSQAGVAQARPGFVAPERPQSPTLCKFGLKCTNPICRWSHPSPVATPESGVVLSNDPCENGKNCKDKDCIKAHVSPATLNPLAVPPEPKSAQYTPPATTHAAPGQTACRFGNACTRPNCPYLHPHRTTATPCRFGSGCTRANCTFQHPEGRVLPSSFHRGLGTSGGLVTVSTPEPGSMGAASHNKSVTFNRNASSADLQKQIKELEEKKNQTQAAMAQAEAAAASKEDGSKSVSISA
ncbi:hypothetical protein EIP91_003919 [Steccherinum ochraceum]|uniref:Nab2 type CCCH zinc finger 4 domain-containing protein n=1 Tax=Steccherinum ochraceum TaxID=92696 RepID=A0A4R0R9P4_9APHY|nr:hypothetical protein EIP91_003919 [Steccherinum ochraceum]